MNDKVIIIGGGLAGLSLANVLKHQGVPYKVFERDATPQARTQGWSISLHFCLPYLKNGMDPEKYSKIGVSSSADPQSPSNHKFYVLDGDNAELFMEPIGTNFEAEVYRINRGRFRKWLLEGIDVEWNKVLDHYEVTESGVKVIFKDGSTETGSVLVGADGVNSAVCAQILGKERFQEATTVNPLQVLCGSFWMDQETRKKYEALAPMQMMIIGSYKGSARCIFSSLTDVDRSGPEPKYEMQWSISSIDPLDKQPETEQERRELVKEWSQEFDPVFQSLLNDTPEDQSIVKLIIRERSPSEDLAEKSEQGRVVLIGDAAHTMTMYRGEGGNHAIQDAAELGLLLADVYKTDKPLAKAVQEYYDAMIPRGQKAVKESHEASLFMHGPKEQVKQTFIMIGQQIAARLEAMKKQEESK